MQKVIDVSEWQGSIDWVKAKPQIDGALLRCGYGASGVDDRFREYADECTRLGIPFGVYIYSYARSNNEIDGEIENVLRLIKGYNLSYPVYIDLEHPGTEPNALEHARRFVEGVEKHGYTGGVYANEYWFTTALKGYNSSTKWVACYSTIAPAVPNYDIWQYTNIGSIDGISGCVDLNHVYRDFAKASPSASKKPEKTTTQKIAEKVSQYQEWLNKYGCGLTVDGIYGAQTNRAAIKVFQTLRGITSDGIVGVETRSKMYDIQYGNEGAIVVWYQGLCSKFGYWDVEQDGIFGTKTENATFVYQQAVGLVPDGIAGVKTLSSMLD